MSPPSPKTSPRHYAAATRIKDVVQFSATVSVIFGSTTSTMADINALGVKY